MPESGSDDTDDTPDAADELELKSIGDFEDEEEILHMSVVSTKSHGHAIRDA